MVVIELLHMRFDLPEQIIALLQQNVSEKRKVKAGKFLRIEDRLRSLAGECLCRKMIHRYFNIPFTSLESSEDALGKPYLLNYPQIHFNISHSGEWVGCAVGTHPVGMDVERHKPISHDIAERFFSRSETDFITAVSEQFTERFFTVWTLKESYIKALGKGFHCPLDSFSVVADGRITSIISNDTIRPMNIESLSVADAYSAAICFDTIETEKPTVIQTDITTFSTSLKT